MEAVDPDAGADDSGGEPLTMQRGRPREVREPVRICVTVEAEVYDRYHAKARQQGHNSIARVMRQTLTASVNRRPTNVAHT
jgi:hypothetical protein